MLFTLENVSNVKLLEFFIGEIYAELLEGIDCEILESKDIEQTNGEGRHTIFLRGNNSLIEFLD